jgi:tetratricopeptide (TPR) repeat protein
MGMLDKLPFTPQDRKLFQKVIQFSVLACVLVAAGFWIAPRMGKHGSANPQAMLGQAIGLGSDESGKLLPIDIEAHEWAADYYLRIDDPQKAIDHLLRILPWKKNDRKTLMELGSAYLQSLQYDNAYQIFRQLTEQNQSDAFTDSINARLGLTLFYLGRIEDAKSTLEKCLAAGKRAPEAACYLGQVLATINPTAPEGEEYLLKAVGWDESYAEAWYQLARYYMATGKYEKSRTHLLHVLDMQPLNEKAHSRLGMAYYYLNQPDLAEKSYITALALNPNDFNTHYNLGELYSATGKPTDALREFKATLSISPDHGEANFKVGLICLSNNMVNEAIHYLAAAAKHEPHNSRVLFQLGVAYEMAGLKQDALAVYQGILGFDPLNDVALQKAKMLSGGIEPANHRARPAAASSSSGAYGTEPAISNADTKTSSSHE